MCIRDRSNENQVIVDINIDKKEKVKVHEITIVGNEAIATKKLKRIMKKTNEKNKLLNLFRTCLLYTSGIGYITGKPVSQTTKNPFWSAKVRIIVER